jgi:hypothetical protein
MLFFGLTFVAGVVAVLAAQTLDIECVNPPAATRVWRAQKTAGRGEASAAFVPGAAFLRQQ